MEGLKTAVVFGGSGTEHDISVLTGLQAGRLLDDAGVSVVCIYWSPNGSWRQVPVASEARSFLEPEVPGEVPLEIAIPGGFLEPRRLRSRRLEIDVVLNACHGGAGEDGSLAALLRLAGMRVTGPSPAASAIAMDKYVTYGLAVACGVPTIDTELVSDEARSSPPWVLKPRHGGSSVGVEAGVRDLKTAKALLSNGNLRSGAVLQPYLDGWVDLNVAVRRYPELQVSAVERPLRSDGLILDYAAKYLRGANGMDTAPRELPARIPPEIADRIKSHAETLFVAAGLSGVPRFDFLWDGGDDVRLCEVNAIPGALGLYLWEAIGVSRSQILSDLLDEAMSEPLLPLQWQGSSDGTALRSATSIAAKLAL